MSNEQNRNNCAICFEFQGIEPQQACCMQSLNGFCMARWIGSGRNTCQLCELLPRLQLILLLWSSHSIRWLILLWLSPTEETSLVLIVHEDCFWVSFNWMFLSRCCFASSHCKSGKCDLHRTGAALPSRYSQRKCLA